MALTLASIRNIPNSYQSVLKGEWDYTKFIGRQINQLKVGVIGYGRLGKLYANYCSSMGAEVFVFDPFIEIKNSKINKINDLTLILPEIDILSIHVHVKKDTINLIDESLLRLMKPDIVIVNTSRGEIINEVDLIKRLNSNPLMKVAVDVVSDEVRNKKNNLLLKFARESNQILITPHIGGMTKEAQEIAYNHSAKNLKTFFKKFNNKVG